MAYTKEKLEQMKFLDLRNAAKELRINASGKKPADLVREILKAQAVASGKGTPADPNPKAAKGGVTKTPASKTPPKERDEDEEDDETPPPKKAPPVASGITKEDVAAAVASATTPLKEEIAKIMAHLNFVVAKVNETRTEVGMDPVTLGGPASPLKGAKASPPKAVEPEDDEEDDEEEDDDEPAAPAAPDDDEEEEEEEEAEEAEEGTLDISAERLATANLDQLRDIAKEINEATGETSVEFDDVKSPRVLRDRIKEFLDSNAEKVVDDEPDPKREKVGKTLQEANNSAVPEHIRLGAKVRVDVEGEGIQNAVVTAIDEDDETATLDFDDDTEAVVGWADVMPPAKVAKKR